MSPAVKYFECRICKSSGNYPVYTALEMMYSSQEPFDYIHCLACGCLQIHIIPDDLSRHYPSNYYSQLARSEPNHPSGVKGALQHWYCRSAALNSERTSGKIIRQFLPVPSDFAEYGHYLIGAKLLKHNEKILDVGCGASPHRLAAFLRCGFTEVEGIDPYIPADMKYHGVPIYRKTIDQISGNYGFIMFHHSLEHVQHPLETLRTAAELLRVGGTCLIRIPIMSTYFWRTFGVNWVELDAPRHLYLMEKRTIEFIAKNTGFRLRETIFDSHGWEISASLKYQSINLHGSHNNRNESEPKIEEYSKQQLVGFENQAAKLNETGDAGRACFYLERI